MTPVNATLAEIMIVTIIPDVEFNAVIEQISKKFGHPDMESLQDESRLITVLNRHQLSLRIGLMTIYHAGNLNACLSTISGLHRFKPTFAFMCGIAGNMDPSKKNLGDVVVSELTSFMSYTKMCEGVLQRTWPQVPPLDSHMITRVRR